MVFASHHWPTWGKDRIVEFLSLQRDLYAYLHDQTLRQLNQGYTGIEIAETFQMPPALEKAWHAHGYYGSVSHNVKAVYQRYMGWFDGNPGRLWAHPPEAIGPRYVEAMGGMSTASSRSPERPSTTVTSAGRQRCSTTRSSPTRATPGRGSLYADTLEQLAYGAENGVWRNFFLSGATELRDGNFGTPTQTASPSIMGQLTPEQMFDTFAINLNGPRAWDLDVAVDITFLDTATNYRVTVRNGVLVYRKSARRRVNRTGDDQVREQDAAVGVRRGRCRLAGTRDHRRCQRDAVDAGGG